MASSVAASLDQSISVRSPRKFVVANIEPPVQVFVEGAEDDGQ